MQSTESNRSESPICQRKGQWLRFWLNSTATLDDCEQKLGNYLWHDSESIASKVCSQNSSSGRFIYKSQAERPALTEGASIFNFKQTALEINHLLCNWPTIQYFISKISTLICPKFQVLVWRFLCLEDLSYISSSYHFLLFVNSLCTQLGNEHWATIAEREKIQLKSMLNAIVCIVKRFGVKNSGVSCHSTWEIRKILNLIPRAQDDI